ncbi:hypothetical protein F8M41_009406 [Gigaspora margarita]|uniref:Uncharacterized protein n=1 Tax=Gigaspora margarita TaxID=4874 RepID=A0A8H4AV97_GIGMA|nr:hypothetical protein F8M41_009406 [Gigaspora margarita]
MMSRRESITTQRDCLASSDRRVSSNRRVSTNNNENNEGENRPEGSLLHNTAPECRSEGSLLRNDSDISMPDIGGSQPPSCMENINEEN